MRSQSALTSASEAQLREAIRREDDWTGKAVTVMGLGLFGGGLGSAALALEKGAQVIVTDLRGPETLGTAIEALRKLPGADRVELVLGEHRDRDFLDADIVVANPAVPPTARHLTLAREGGARVTSAIELLLGALRCRVVAITGTHGKSSTVHFTADLLRAGLGPDVRVVLGGNIGGSLLGEIDSLREQDVVVLELSSYQLENLSADFVAEASVRRALDVAAITTIGVDHLARHGTVEVYRAAKLRIAQLTGQAGSKPGAVIAPASEGDALREAQKATQRLLLTEEDTSGDAVLAQLQVPGEFQRKNLRVALAVAAAVGADGAKMQRAIPTLTGLPHRMERLGTWPVTPDGRALVIYDNGVSTTPESTVAAMESVSQDRRPGDLQIVLVGGQAKRGCDMKALGEAAAALGWALVPFGAASDEITAIARESGATLASDASGLDRDAVCEGVEDAVRVALKYMAGAPARALERQSAAAPNTSPMKQADTVHLLFSPACASFDRYPNFKERALAFRAALAAALDLT